MNALTSPEGLELAQSRQNTHEEGVGSPSSQVSNRLSSTLTTLQHAKAVYALLYCLKKWRKGRLGMSAQLLMVDDELDCSHKDYSKKKYHCLSCCVMPRGEGEQWQNTL